MSVSDDPDIPPSTSRGEMMIRVVVGLIGIGVLAVGAHKFFALPDRESILKWAIVPAIIHDLLVAPAVCLLGWAAGRLLPTWTRVPLLAGTLVTAGLVLVSLSVLGKHGASPLNPSLDNRDYGLGLAVVLALVWGGVTMWLLGSAVLRRRSR